MHSVKAHFDRLEDVSLFAAYDELGVYSLWSSAAAIRPSYIGEGNVLRRFVDHLGKTWAKRPVNGVIWLFDWRAEGLTLKEAKWVTESVERALLLVGEHIDCFPIHNKHPGRDSSIGKLLNRLGESSLRITFSGFDPLRAPENSRMSSPKRIWLQADTFETSDWRKAPK